MISEHFSRHEFACHCDCGEDTVDGELLTVLEDVRVHFGAPVSVSSGHRCPSHNKAVGGGKDSQHLRGRAADINVEGVAPYKVFAYLDALYPDQYGMGSYTDFTHIDTRGKKARW
jgi:uncharacterized protein YcbK (DUF882 family)